MKRTQSHVKKKPAWQSPGMHLRKLTPQNKAAVLAGWIPLDTEPIDRFTPDFFKDKGNWDFPDVPVLLIRKPTQIDVLRELEMNPEETKKAIEDLNEIRRNPNKKRDMNPVALTKSIIFSTKNYLVGMENYRTASGEVIEFHKNKEGSISDETLNIIARSWQMMLAIHLRVISLKTLSGLELESFESSPVSVTG